ncbi:HesA/MoeB/ThiF family protein [Virgibacillus flavescens]|uniref:HesA/MoeB/ThiF family protein n=1 Tax=Virgibacillus flavescens TaxID=1611422 RepID=UPI003D33B8C0
MGEIQLWYKEMPEVFEREKRILESRGFLLKQHSNTIEFTGNSSVLKEYPLRIIYPNGYPSFPPTVISEVKDELVLKSHQRILNKVLCCFGFASERWRADFTAKEVLQEAEELIVNFSPLTIDGDSEVYDESVPEPIVNQYNYADGGFLIPTPFGDMSFNELKDTNEGTINYSTKQKRGIITSLDLQGENKIADDGYKGWFKGSTMYRSKIYKVFNPPPLTTTNIKSWLLENDIRINPNRNHFLFFVFEDEWGKKGNKRMAWIALKILQGNASWIQCYLVSEDDTEIRTPHGSLIREKVVTVVGAGSLGSIVSTTLAQEGVQKFYLFDYDTYEPSNAIRHQVRQYWFGLSKVNGVSERIKELSPTAEVEVYNVAVGSSKDQGNYQKVNKALANSDIVVDTTGEHGVSHFLNRFCVKNKIPLVIGSVTNGAWSCEVVKYIPNHSGCWGCWNRSYGYRNPPSSPTGEMQFAPGCDQPTFIGGISSINIAGGLVSHAIIDTLLNVDLDAKHYILWSERDCRGNRNYDVEYLKNPALEDCEVCNENH